MQKYLVLLALACACAPEPTEPVAPTTDAGVVDAGEVQIDASSTPDTAPPPAVKTIWSGDRITFTKPNFADPQSPEAQDRITDSVVLTRGSGNILYNIVEEVGVNRSVSPAGTLWAMGTTEQLDSLTFQPLKQAANSRMQDLPNQDMVLHLVEDNIYIDLRFLSWAVGQSSGGGFSYERTTPN